MKKIAICVLGLVALVSLSGCAGSGTSSSTAQNQEIKVGTFVAVQWQDGRYYLTTVQKIDSASGKYTVKFSDGSEDEYTKDLLIIVPPKLTLKAGDVVSASYPESGKFYPAKVKEVNDLGVMVAWDDGSADSLLTQGRIILGTLK